MTHSHSLSPSYHAAVIESDASGTYAFHSPGISYSGFIGRTFGCRFRLAVFFPVHLFQDGAYFHAREFYSVSIGGDALLGASAHLRFRDGQSLEVELGPSVNAIKLGSDAYESFYSFTFGVGTGIAYAYPLHRNVTLGSFISAALHFLDWIHETNSLKVGVFVSAGLTLGFSVEGKR